MKIAICTPVHGDTRKDFTFCLARMLIRTLEERSHPTIEIFTAESSSVAANREYLVDKAIEAKANGILWLDSDQTFPSDTLLRLINHRKPVVGANYPRRGGNFEPTATTIDNGEHCPVWTTPEKVKAGKLEPVDYLGLGVCFTSMEAIRAIVRPCFDGSAEDEYFFLKLKGAGIPALVDHALSAEVGHVHTQILTLQGSLMRHQRAIVAADLKARRNASGQKA
jgi:hypothetical protein